MMIIISSSYAAFVLMRKLSFVPDLSSFIPLFLRGGKPVEDWKRCAETHGVGRIKTHKVMEQANQSTVNWTRRTLCACDRRIVDAVWSGLLTTHQYIRLVNVINVHFLS